MDILIVEDDDKLGKYLRKGLSAEGFSVVVTPDGLEGLQLALEGEYDGILLDRKLPSLDGLAFIKALRSQRKTPVLILTAIDSVEDRVDSLEAGADDYLTKPFAFSELVARLYVITRRGGDRRDHIHPETLSFHDLEIDVLRRKVFRGKTQIELTVKEFALLELMIQKPGYVYSRAVIAERIWGVNFDSGTNVIDVSVRRLRTKVDLPFDCNLIHTVRGIGYVIEHRPDSEEE